MASISLFREQLSGPKATPFPAVLEPVSFYQRSHFLITVRRGERLSWCLLTSQSTFWPPGSLSTCGSSHPSLPPKPLLLTGSPYPASHSLTAYHLCYSFSWSPVFVFFYCPPPPVSFACSLSTPSPQTMAWSSLLSIFSVLLSLPALGSSRGPWLYPPSDQE